MQNISSFQQVIEIVEALSLEDQAVLVDIIQQRLRQQRREALLEQVSESEQAYSTGQVHRGSVADLMRELDD
jgi:tetrahydromethanopterin S-methyltransferase subunit A